MNSPFAVFALEPRPWLEEEQIEQIWHQRSKELHPDRQDKDKKNSAQQAQFLQLQQAKEQLLDPGKRIKALLGAVWPQRIQVTSLAVLEPDLEELFAAVQTVLPQAQAFAQRWNQANSQLGKALLTAEQMEVLTLLQQTLARVATKWDEAEQKLRGLDQQFQQGLRDEELYQKLNQVRARFGWLAKWRQQLSHQVGELF